MPATTAATVRMAACTAAGPGLSQQAGCCARGRLPSSRDPAVIGSGQAPARRAKGPRSRAQ